MSTRSSSFVEAASPKAGSPNVGAHKEPESAVVLVTVGSQKSQTFWMWVCALTTLVSGVMCSVSVKMMFLRSLPAEDGGAAIPFNQPFWPTFVMFAGESLCLFAWQGDEWVKKRKSKVKGLFEFPSPGDLQKPHTPFWWWALPACIDLIGTSAINAAMTMTYASTIGMLRNAMLIFCCVITMGLMKRPLRVHEWVGIVVMTAGMIAAGITSVLHPDPTAANDKAWLGIILSIAGTGMSALQLIVEEKFLEKTYTPPLKGVGIEGISGFLLTIVIIGVCHAAGWYNFQEGWYQMNHSGWLLGSNLWYLGVVFIFNGAGLMTTALGSGLLRGVIFSCRAPIVWVIELICEWNVYSGGGLASVILSAAGFLLFSYIVPFVSRKRTPRVHKALRRDIPCFCTVPFPDSDADADADPGTPATDNAEPQDKI